MKNSSKKTLDWFESRIGQHVFRKPIFESEQSKPVVSIRIRDKRHAKILFDLQKANRPEYVDHSGKVEIDLDLSKGKSFVISVKGNTTN